MKSPNMMMWCIALICLMNVISDQSLTVGTDNGDANNNVSEPTTASLTSSIKNDPGTTSFNPSTAVVDKTKYDSTTITYPNVQTVANVGDKITTKYARSKQTTKVENSKNSTPTAASFSPIPPIPVDACNTEHLTVTSTPVLVMAFTRDLSEEKNCSINVTAPNNTAIVVRLIKSNFSDISTYFYTENVGTLPQNCTDPYVLVSVDHMPCAVIISGSQFRFNFQNSDMLIEVHAMDVEISTCFDTQTLAMGQGQCKIKSYAGQIQPQMIYDQFYGRQIGWLDVTRYSADCTCDCQCMCTLGYREWLSICIDGKYSNTTRADVIVYKPNMKRLSFRNTGMSAIQAGAFDSLGELLLLDLSDNSIPNLQAGVFDSLGNLTYLMLSDNNIAGIPAGVFDSLGNLSGLYLGGNNIAAVQAGVLDSLGNLTYLDLSSNNIPAIPAGVFDLLGNLVYLDLNANNIPALSAGVFDSLVNLNKLRLGDNNIAALQTGMFDSLGNLNGLYLGGNNIAVVQAGVFESLGNLTYLHLSDNNIAALPAGVFDTLVNLNELSLGDNNIAALQAGMFDSLVNLAFLDLSDNSIAGIPAGVFDLLGNLNGLHLGGNNIPALPADVFDSLGNLEDLHLGKNNIAAVQAGAFDSLGELLYLNMSDNNISVLTAGVFDSLGGLWDLDLSDNNIAVLPARVFDTLGNLESLHLGDNSIAALPAGVFDSLGRLWDLDLSNNNIAALPARVFDSLGRMRYKLDLSDNNLADLPRGVFNSLGWLGDLDISGNNLSSLHEDIFTSLRSLDRLNIGHNYALHNLSGDVFKSLKSLKILFLSHNAIEILPLKLFIALQNLLVLDISSNTLPSLPSESFSTLKELVLLNVCCNNLTINATQTFSSLTKLKVLDLRRNNIRQLPTHLFWSNKNLESLDISENYLKVIPVHCFTNLSRLIYLNMSENSLFGLPSFSAQGELQVLDLSGNSFNKLTPDNFINVRKLTVLSLCKNNLVALPTRMFYRMNHLIFINASYNEIQRIGPNIFSNKSKLQTFDIRKNTMYKVSLDSFKTNPPNANIIVDKYATCCFMDEAQCVSLKPRPEYLTCKRMLQDVILRISVWVLGLSAFICNGIAYYVRSGKKQGNKVQTLLISHLALSDLLMGVNMLILASADVYYGEFFPSYAHLWRQGFACKLAGFLSIFSSEGSVLFIALISIDRLLGIKYPFGGPLSTKWARFCVVLAWLVAFLLSVIPIALATDTGDVFSISEVCIGIPIVRSHLETLRNTSAKINVTIFKTTFVKGWKQVSETLQVGYDLGGINITQHQQPQNIIYSVADIIGSQLAPIFSIVVFVGVNLTCFIIVAFCYMYIFIKAGKTSEGAGRTLDRDEQIRMAKKMFAIVFTDFFCWVPLCFICILVQCGVITVSPKMYAWTVGFILPINSSINPFLYVLYETIINHLKKKREERKARETSR